MPNRSELHFLRIPRASLAWVLLALSWISPVQAADARYRIEVMLFEAADNRAASVEQYSARALQQLPEDGTWLWKENMNGQGAATQMNLLQESSLTLKDARAKLQAGGRYRVQFVTGWIQNLPLDQPGKPLLIGLGPLDNNHFRIEGYLKIEQKRYLHVEARLQSLKLTRKDGGETHAEVANLINETRRMQGGEMHYLDSPGLGLLVYIQPVMADGNPGTAAPRIPAAPSTASPNQPPATGDNQFRD